eukprot:COSAG01_NODE_1283_length_10920_cov_5.539507_9_plen_1896_part_00
MKRLAMISAVVSLAFMGVMLALMIISAEVTKDTRPKATSGGGVGLKDSDGNLVATGVDQATGTAWNNKVQSLSGAISGQTKAVYALSKADDSMLSQLYSVTADISLAQDGTDLRVFRVSTVDIDKPVGGDKIVTITTTSKDKIKVTAANGGTAVITLENQQVLATITATNARRHRLRRLQGGVPPTAHSHAEICPDGTTPSVVGVPCPHVPGLLFCADGVTPMEEGMDCPHVHDRAMAATPPKANDAYYASIGLCPDGTTHIEEGLACPPSLSSCTVAGIEVPVIHGTDCSLLINDGESSHRRRRLQNATGTSSGAASASSRNFAVNTTSWPKRPLPTELAKLCLHVAPEDCQCDGVLGPDCAQFGTVFGVQLIADKDVSPDAFDSAAKKLAAELDKDGNGMPDRAIPTNSAVVIHATPAAATAFRNSPGLGQLKTANGSMLSLPGDLHAAATKSGAAKEMCPHCAATAKMARLAAASGRPFLGKRSAAAIVAATKKPQRPPAGVNPFVFALEQKARAMCGDMMWSNCTADCVLDIMKVHQGKQTMTTVPAANTLVKCLASSHTKGPCDQSSDGPFACDANGAVCAMTKDDCAKKMQMPATQEDHPCAKSNFDPNDADCENYLANQAQQEYTRLNQQLQHNNGVAAARAAAGHVCREIINHAPGGTLQNFKPLHKQQLVPVVDDSGVAMSADAAFVEASAKLAQEFFEMFSRCAGAQPTQPAQSPSNKTDNSSVDAPPVPIPAGYERNVCSPKDCSSCSMAECHQLEAAQSCHVKVFTLDDGSQSSSCELGPKPRDPTQRDCYATPCVDSPWVNSFGHTCKDLRTNGNGQRDWVDKNGTLAEHACCQFCPSVQSAPPICSASACDKCSPAMCITMGNACHFDYRADMCLYGPTPSALQPPTNSTNQSSGNSFGGGRRRMTTGQPPVHSGISVDVNVDVHVDTLKCALQSINAADGTMTSKEAIKAFEVADRNSNGYLSANEFVYEVVRRDSSKQDAPAQRTCPTPLSAAEVDQIIMNHNFPSACAPQARACLHSCECRATVTGVCQSFEQVMIMMRSHPSKDNSIPVIQPAAAMANAVDPAAGAMAADVMMCVERETTLAIVTQTPVNFACPTECTVVPGTLPSGCPMISGGVNTPTAAHSCQNPAVPPRCDCPAPPVMPYGSVKAELEVYIDPAAIVDGTPARASFEANFKRDLAAQMSRHAGASQPIPSTQIQVDDVIDTNAACAATAVITGAAACSRRMLQTAGNASAKITFQVMSAPIKYQENCQNGTCTISSDYKAEDQVSIPPVSQMLNQVLTDPQVKIGNSEVNPSSLQLLSVKFAPNCSQQLPFSCLDGSCAATPAKCVLANGCFEATPVLCQSGACETAHSDCKMPNGCPEMIPLRCRNNTCVSDAMQCKLDNGCHEDTPFKCQWNFDVAGYTHCGIWAGDCPTRDGCTEDMPHKCQNGTCEISRDYCVMSNGCPETHPVWCDDPNRAIGAGGCLDKLDMPGAAKPRSDYISCAVEAAQGACGDNPTIQSGCTKTCGLCKSGRQSGTAAMTPMFIQQRCNKTDADCGPPPDFGCTSDRPRACDNGSCEKSVDRCKADNGCHQVTPIRCPTSGQCAVKVMDCFLPNGCPTDLPIKCSNSTSSDSCQRRKEDCYMQNGCPETKPVLCPWGDCRQHRSSCIDPYTGCHQDIPHKCQNGSCVDNHDSCRLPNGCPEHRTYKCQTPQPYDQCAYHQWDCLAPSGCPEPEPYKCADGSCHASENACPKCDYMNCHACNVTECAALDYACHVDPALLQHNAPVFGPPPTAYSLGNSTVAYMPAQSVSAQNTSLQNVTVPVQHHAAPTAPTGPKCLYGADPSYTAPKYTTGAPVPQCSSTDCYSCAAAECGTNTTNTSGACQLDPYTQWCVPIV